MTSDDRFVRFEDVQKSYDGETLVVKSLNLDIARGEFITMLGPSGSGKTTCLMMLAGFETATHGEIYLDGRPVNRVAPYKRNIGVVFQNYALFPHMTVAENLAYPLEARKLPKAEIETKVQQALAMVRLEGFGPRRPGQLSGGQKQRVAVARALIFDPQLVLMDEPLGALDRQLREQMQYEIKHIHEQLGVTIVYVTHDQSEALTMSDRVAVFESGIIQQIAAPKDLYEHPENSFVAQFIGENNRLLGTVEAADDRHCQVKLDSGEVIKAIRVNFEGVGSRTSLSLRPERVKINPQPGSLDNEIPGRIQELIYLGDHVRTRAQVANHDDFVVKIPNDAAHAQLAEGDMVVFGWMANDCRGLDA